MQNELFDNADPRVYVTSDGESRRTFVWARTRWYERLFDATTGAVEFSRVADSDEELRDWLREQDPDLDIDERDESFAELVREEFLNQTPLYPEAPELSDQAQ